MRGLLRHPTGMVGAVLVAVVVLTAAVSLVWTPRDPLAVDPADSWAGPSAQHWIGADALGRDLFSQLVRGAQVTVLASVGAAVIALVVGLAFAAGIAFGSPVVSGLVQRGVDLLIAFPTLVIAIILVTSFQASTLMAVLAIGLGMSVAVTRTVLPELQRALASDFVLLARAAGARAWWIGTRHVLPSISASLLVRLTQLMGVAALAEAGLSYLGFGTPPPTPSWGRTLADLQSQVMTQPEVLLFPALAIVVVVLGFNLLGDGLRDVLDPRAREVSA
ncbi:hypothetical protein A7K94_0215365 [Modestobacter sp. VKM Ac-2676]|nr:hypothetical protein A7K94_0215365 [Modestobacter sp. VKM Ac-2676]